MSIRAYAICACGVYIIGYRVLWATPVCIACLPPPPFLKRTAFKLKENA